MKIPMLGSIFRNTNNQSISQSIKGLVICLKMQCVIHTFRRKIQYKDPAESDDTIDDDICQGSQRTFVFPNTTKETIKQMTMCDAYF